MMTRVVPSPDAKHDRHFSMQAVWIVYRLRSHCGADACPASAVCPAGCPTRWRNVNIPRLEGPWSVSLFRLILALLQNSLCFFPVTNRALEKSAEQHNKQQHSVIFFFNHLLALRSHQVNKQFHMVYTFWSQDYIDPMHSWYPVICHVDAWQI